MVYQTSGQAMKVSQSEPREQRRSQAIPIKMHPSRDDEFDEEILQSGSNRNAYDMATWRMYYRIVDYRQRNPPLTDSHQTSYCPPSPKCVMSGSLHEQPKANLADKNIADSATPTTMRSNDENRYEGEVFELDLWECPTWYTIYIFSNLYIFHRLRFEPYIQIR